jgi:hypothetical protein
MKEIMLTVLKIWNLFLVSGSGPTGFKGGQRGRKWNTIKEKASSQFKRPFEKEML